MKDGGLHPSSSILHPLLFFLAEHGTDESAFGIIITLPDGGSTAVWGFDGTTSGPALRIRRGEELRIRLINDLPEPTALHWHGVRLPNAMDGVPDLTQPPVAPGRSFDYRFRPPDAGTFWYRPAGNAAAQIGRGLRGCRDRTQQKRRH